MDFLVELDEKKASEDKLECLKQRKQDLLNKLDTLKNEMINGELDNQTKQDPIVQKYGDIIQSYSLLGVTLQSTDPVIILQLDALYRNQHPGTEYYNIQLKAVGGNLTLGQHNLPPFIPAKELSESHVASNVPEFLKHIQQYLYAYIQRRESVKHAQEGFGKYIVHDIEVDLPVTYVRLHLRLEDQIPQMDISLTYDLLKCIPDKVYIESREGDAGSMSKKHWEQTVKNCEDILLSNDLHTALTKILLKYLVKQS